MLTLEVLTSIAQVVVVIIGFTIAIKSYKISFQNKENMESYFFLAIGFLLYSIGMTIESLLLFFKVNVGETHFVETILGLLGSIAIIRAIMLIRE